MSRRLMFAFVFGCSLFAGPAMVMAQAPAAAPLPLAVDLRKVPVGSWAEYKIGDGKENMAVRMALVSHTAKSANIETKVSGGALAALGAATVRMTVPLDGDGEAKPQEQVIQIGDNDPMTLPASMAGGRTQSFKKVDPKKRVSVDSVTVAGGAFAHADHYQEKGPQGESIDYWISKDVMPFGLVKVVSGMPGADAKGKVTMELAAHGAGAKAVITKTPKPFDPQTMMKQVQPAGATSPMPPPSGPVGATPPPVAPGPAPAAPPAKK